MLDNLKNLSLKGLFKKSPKKTAAKPAAKKDSKVAILGLLVLVLAGAGYVYMNGGIEPVLNMVGLGSEAVPPPTPPAARPRIAAPAPAKPALISRKPVNGQVQGKPFQLDYSQLKNGVLLLRQGKEFAKESEITIALPNQKWQVPQGKTLKFSKATRQNNPELTINWKPAGQREMETKVFDGNYDLEIKFNRQQGENLPGKITLVLQDSEQTRISGTFKAKLEGFKIVNGRPDLSSDSNETLIYVALTHVLKNDPEQPIQNISYSNTQYSAAGENKSGSLIMAYQIGKKPEVKQKFDFKKENNEWTVSKTNKIK
jgi:hypothetical protein